MGVFKTYRDAVIANGSTKGVYTNLNKDEFHTCYAWRGLTLHHCNPADYLESVADFQARGKLLALGDDVTGINGHVVSVKRHSYNMWNSPDEDHNKRFILQAAADSEDTGTPEEREVFEAMSESVSTAYPEQGETVSTPVGIGEFVAKVTKRGVTRCIVQFENSYGEFSPEAVTPFGREYEAGKKLWGLWLDCQPEEATTRFDKIDLDTRNAWIELAKRVKVLDNKE